MSIGLMDARRLDSPSAPSSRRHASRDSGVRWLIREPEPDANERILLGIQNLEISRHQ